MSRVNLSGGALTARKLSWGGPGRPPSLPMHKTVTEGSQSKAMAIQYGKLSIQRHYSHYNPCLFTKF